MKLRELQEGQEKRDNCAMEKLKAEHEAEIGRLQKVQLRLEKEVLCPQTSVLQCKPYPGKR